MKRKAGLRGLMAEVMLGAFLPCTLAAWAVTGSGESRPEFSGMVWERHGDWHLNGSSEGLRLGEGTPPGGLVTAGPTGAQHSIVLLLPDGQRLLFECYDAKECSQGFRVPAITPDPSRAVWDMFVAVRNVLLLRPASSETAFPLLAGRAAMAAKYEVVAPVTPQGEVSIAPALQYLPSGQYSLSLSGEAGPANSPITNAVLPLHWSAGQQTAPVRVGDPGLYRIQVTDEAHVPRIQIEVLATSPGTSQAETERLKQARGTVLHWSHTHPGWPLDAFLRVYLESRLSVSPR